MTKTKVSDIKELPGVGAATAEKLEGAGYRDMLSIAVASPAELIEIAGVTEASARKIISAAREAMEMGFETGEEILKKRELIERINSGSEALDQMLGGGFETGAITEAFGEFGSGKTQIGHVLTVNMLKQNPEAMTVYIDTESTFRPERIIQLAEGAGMDSKEVLKRIIVAKAYNSDHQMLLTEKVEDLIKKDGKNVKLVIIDSLTAHFRAEFIGRGTLADRQQKLNRHLHTLMRLAETNNLCVYVTNQVMAKPDTFFGDPTQAIGGHIVAHASTYRIYLRKGKKGSRVAKLIDSPSMPEAEAAFIVETRGLKDI
ncbi:MAG TPA: DNA repair and recombination protein RadA [Candidatus Nanoarchaeia archaeon]|nr:DNA repair and recombination protein RadA [Candidatus Nanoarchaeia archaeon]